MSDFDKLAEQFEKMLDENDFSEDEHENEGKKLIRNIETILVGHSFNVDVAILKKYDVVISRGLWDKQLVDELQEVKALLLNLQ